MRDEHNGLPWYIYQQNGLAQQKFEEKNSKPTSKAFVDTKFVETPR
jgi:hypothetical protein